jgi:hypothetical protein
MGGGMPSPFISWENDIRKSRERDRDRDRDSVDDRSQQIRVNIYPHATINMKHPEKMARNIRIQQRER